MIACDAILLAGGRGERLGQDRPKAMVTLGGQPLFVHALRKLDQHPRIGRIVLVVPREAEAAEEVRNAAAASEVEGLEVVKGGESRQASVMAGLQVLKRRGVERHQFVLVHDSARPVLNSGLIDRCLAGLEGEGPGASGDVIPGIPTASWGRGPAGVIPGLPVRETLKLVYESRVVMTQPREQLYSVQTPQGFRFGPLFDAHERALRQGHDVTDDAGLLEWLGMTVTVVPGDSDNLKVTYPEDLLLAERILEAGVR